MPAPGQFEQHPVSVQLQLARCGVADPHGSRSPVALEVFEAYLGEPTLAAHAVEDLHILGAPCGAALDKTPEPVGLGREADLREGADAEEGIPEPAVTVIPVEVSSRALG